ncbi:ArsR/SmtB family transcription factor [Clostridium sp. Marseille-P299]|uniref:ArsR/SmtB family transcription factor n=1 Tax=Clostridium sp. Marseille-P299 TaxID=1805477 RepID=UPI00082B2B3A|nr:winged helix-turn-helix transcriptional regulator [Clostridium sp. Marseille-P299]
MLHITSLDTGLELFKTLGSDVRIDIIKLLLNNKDMNLNELATNLNITNGALTSHIKKLEDCGLIKITNEATGHGNEKHCRVCLDKILVDIASAEVPSDIYEANVLIGQYSDYQIEPCCGLATQEGLLGELDNIRYFSHPDRMLTNMLWFQKGFVEYLLPNFIPTAHVIDEITIQMELASIVTNCDSAFASELEFYLNQVSIGKFMIAGDTGSESGVYTPNWFDTSWKQHGVLKQISIKKEGTFIDGMKLSDVTIDSFQLDYSSILKFKIAVTDNPKYFGGISLFGKGFGNYNQDIRIQIKHS